MPGPSETETSALKELWIMLRFAALREPKLDAAIVDAVYQATEAAETGTWTAATSKLFWDAYAGLSTLLWPSSIDCLKVSQPVYPRSLGVRLWQRYVNKGPEGWRNLAELTSVGYQTWLVLLIFLTAGLQFYLSVHKNFVDDIDATYRAQQANVTALTAEYKAFTDATAGIEPKDWSHAQINQSAQIANDSKVIVEESVSIWEKTIDYDQLIPFFTHPVSNPAVASRPKTDAWFDWYDAALASADATQSLAAKIDSGARGAPTAISTFLLPILYAAIGSIAYILRKISVQLKDTTFSSSSPIRHALRLWLGVMMGLIIGAFSNLTAMLGPTGAPADQGVVASPLAIAFLAGYGVEAFLSMFDAIIARFVTSNGAEDKPRRAPQATVPAA
jgi:hypothetical protein